MTKKAARTVNVSSVVTPDEYAWHRNEADSMGITFSSYIADVLSETRHYKEKRRHEATVMHRNGLCDCPKIG